MGLDDKNRPLYMISIAAELAGVHPQTLRSYEQKGLVTPRRTQWQHAHVLPGRYRSAQPDQRADE